MSTSTLQQDLTRPGIDIKKLKSGFGRRQKAFWLTFFAMAALSVAAVVLIPATYLSKATILIEQQEIPPELVRSTVTSYADQRIEVITQRVMTSMNLWQIIEKYGLYQSELKKETRESVIEEMREKDIKRNIISADVVDPRSGRPTEATIAFQLSFEYENPGVAQKVANELTSLFLSENIKSRTQMAEQASLFLQAEAQKLSQQVSALEAELASFKESNFDSLPELTRLNLNLLDRTEQSIKDNRTQMNSVKERIKYLESQLAILDPDAPLVSSGGERYLSSLARLKLAKQQLDQQRARYSESHPNVIRLEMEVNALLDEVDDRSAPELKLELYLRKLNALRQRYSDEHPSVIAFSERISQLEKIAEEVPRNAYESDGADNPAYVQVKGQLETAHIELAGLVERQASLAKDVSEYEARLLKAPRIEQQYQQLNRDYQSAVLKYAEVKAKQQEANLSEALESEQKGERFTLIEPPLVPEEAHSPNRALLGVMGVFLTLGLSIGIVILLEVMDGSIRSRRDLELAIGAPPLAVIPLIVTKQETKTMIKRRWIIVLLVIAAGISGLLMIHLMLKPLDVLWYVLLRKLG